VWTFRREAARAVVLDASDRVLLIQASDPVDPSKGEWWEIPGGGLDPGEASADAARREVYEETGLEQVEVGPCVWTHRSRFTFAGMRFDQRELIHVARWSGDVAGPGGADGAGEYRPGGLEAIEAVAFKGMRWWTLDELSEHVAAGGRVLPPWLPEQLPRYLADGHAGEPIDLGELPPVF
jgi:8-oxo-dGTP pyrophosphatase MutT (NUDIX family)